MKVIQMEIDLLVDYSVNRDGSIYHYLKNNWLQLDDYQLFIRQMREIHYTNQHSHYNHYIHVSYNHYQDHKVHFKINTFFKEEKIITFEKFSRAVWEYLKNTNANRSEQGRCEQLTLF